MAERSNGTGVTIWDLVAIILYSYLFVGYLVVLFQITGDLFRDRELGGVAKALWLVALIGAPFLSAVVYLIARGRGMGDRHEAMTRQARQRTDRYLQYVANRPSSAEQITAAKKLRDEGTITQVEFEGLKAKALAAPEEQPRHVATREGAVSIT